MGDGRDRYLDLADRHFDGELTAAESRELGQVLAGNAQCAREFARRAMFHNQLRALLRLEEQEEARDRADVGGQRVAATAWWRLAAVAAACVLLGLAIVELASFRSSSGTSDRGNRLAVAVAQPPVAKLAAAFDAVWSDPNVAFALRQGDMPPGMLVLRSGRVELLFAAGATAIIEGPATFEPVSGDTLRVQAGSVRCRCPRPGTELRVETPSGTIVDLGTEFAVSVEPDVRTRVAVIEGQVRVDGRESSQLMSAGEAVSIDRTGKSSLDIGFLKDVATKVTLSPVDPSIFATCDNALVDPSFEIQNGDAAEGRPDLFLLGEFRLGAWQGSLGHVEQVAAPAASGSRAVRIAARGNRFWPLVAQHVETGDIAGRAVMAAVRVCQSPEDPLAGHQSAILKLMFVDERGTQFASAERYFLRSGSPLGAFVDASIAALAPAGTVAVQYQFLLNARGQPSGSVVVDDAVLKIGPP
jgi:hypothetical protein